MLVAPVMLTLRDRFDAPRYGYDWCLGSSRAISWACVAFDALRVILQVFIASDDKKHRPMLNQGGASLPGTAQATTPWWFQ